MPYQTVISVSQLEGHVRDPNWIILDARFDLNQPEWGAQSYRDGHIPSAQFVDLEKDLSAPKTGTNGRHPLPTVDVCVALFSRLGIADGKQVVVYDQSSNMYSARAWWMLRWLGFESVAVLDGGYKAWQEKNGEIETQVRQVGSSIFLPRVQRDMLVLSDDLKMLLDDPRLCLIDARAKERYLGLQEPLDPIAGHIPRAMNRFWKDNLTPQDTFLPANEVRSVFSNYLGQTPSHQVIHQCGSGVSACHNVLAMEMAGLSGSRLYAGSWSEWCSLEPTLVEREENPPKLIKAS
jgi:thiosulfate/3-mercaptopyruvate sulfurtransferase